MRGGVVFGRDFAVVGEAAFEFAFGGGATAGALFVHVFFELRAPIILDWFAPMKRFFERKFCRETVGIVKFKDHFAGDFGCVFD